MRKVDELSEELVRNALIDMGNEIADSWDRAEVEKEVRAMTSLDASSWPAFLKDSAVLKRRLEEIEQMGKAKIKAEAAGSGGEDVLAEAGRSPKVQEEYLLSAAEFIVNICLGRNWISSREAIGAYVPREIPWSQKTGWK